MCHISKFYCDVPYTEILLWCAKYRNFTVRCHVSKFYSDVPYTEILLWCATYRNFTVVCHIPKFYCDMPYAEMLLWCAIYRNFTVRSHVSKFYSDVPYTEILLWYAIYRNFIVMCHIPKFYCDVSYTEILLWCAIYRNTRYLIYSTTMKQAYGLAWFHGMLVRISLNARRERTQTPREFIHSVFRLATSLLPLAKRVLNRTRSSASSFGLQRPLFPLRPPNSCLSLLPRLSLTSIPSITRFRRQFSRKMWPIQLVLLLFYGL